MIDGEATPRPLLVTEGSAGEKARAIAANDYLAHALDRLFEVHGPVVVFGSRLAKQHAERDAHLTEICCPIFRVATEREPLAGRQAEMLERWNRPDAAGGRGRVASDPGAAAWSPFGARRVAAPTSRCSHASQMSPRPAAVSTC